MKGKSVVRCKKVHFDSIRIERIPLIKEGACIMKQVMSISLITCGAGERNHGDFQEGQIWPETQAYSLSC